ncbi:hypothetical protein KKG31_07400 [Patescibacteria group bacterium]|nr:hypothetical protein [Patescibacteria group bacterium]MBU1758902.1 hypothetical protein [Patescibacteria group bacterium]
MKKRYEAQLEEKEDQIEKLKRNSYFYEGKNPKSEKLTTWMASAKKQQ